MEINDKQKKYLRGLAHDLKPIVQVGNAGVTPALMRELETHLKHHELLKVKLRVDDHDARTATINQVVTQSAATLVGHIGKTAILYRMRKNKPAIVLP